MGIPPLSGVCAICLVDNLHNNGPRIGEEQINTVAVRNRGLPALRVRPDFFFLPLRYILVTLLINAIRENGSFESFFLSQDRWNPQSRRGLTSVIGTCRPRFSRGDSAKTIEKTARGFGYRFLHQYLIAANKMAMVCAPPRWAIKA